MFGNEWNCNCPGSYALGTTLRSPEAAVNSVYTMTTRLGPSFRNAQAVLAPRVLRFGVNVNF